MIKLDDIERIYFLGIGGIGMSALARYFMAKRFKVAGYDRDQSEICISLKKDSCEIFFDDDPTLIPPLFREKTTTLVVYTTSVTVLTYKYRYLPASTVRGTPGVEHRPPSCKHMC